MGLMDIFNSKKNRLENERLNAFIIEIGATDALAVKNKTDELKKIKSDIEAQINHLNQNIEQLNLEIKSKNNEIIVLDDEILFESFALYKPKFVFQTSEEYKLKLIDTRAMQKQRIKDGEAVNANTNWTINNSKREGGKMVRDISKLLLRSFNNECDSCVENVKFNNIETCEKRIEKSFETINKLGTVMQISIDYHYKELKYDELYLAYEYQQKKQEEKEEQKRLREELKEQQKLEQEIKEARARIEKERKHFSQALKELQEKLSKTTKAEDIKALDEKIAEINIHCKELDEEEKVVDYRLQNAKAGYVYVISNIGAFGENIYKIGMTRRLEPMERIDELGDASVPFPFDVHALVFSENAPELESKLHDKFFASRLNKLNNRKEFFRADIDAIEKVIHDNYDKIVDIVKIPPAEQYRESLIQK